MADLRKLLPRQRLCNFVCKNFNLHLSGTTWLNLTIEFEWQWCVSLQVQHNAHDWCAASTISFPVLSLEGRDDPWPPRDKSTDWWLMEEAYLPPGHRNLCVWWYLATVIFFNNKSNFDFCSHSPLNFRGEELKQCCRGKLVLMLVKTADSVN